MYFVCVCVCMCTHAWGAWTHVRIHEHQARTSGVLLSWSSSSLEPQPELVILVRPARELQNLPVSTPQHGSDRLLATCNLYLGSEKG